MGLIKRLHRITIGRIEAFLDKVEDPEVLFPQLVKEMEEQLRTATTEEAAAIAATKRAEHAVEKATAKVEQLGRGAEQAVAVGEDDTARGALTAQIDTEKTAEMCKRDLETLAATVDLATAARKQIAEQLDQLRAKKNEILTRARVAKTRRKIQRTVSGSVGSSGSILDAVARLEASVEETETELEIQAKLAGDVRVSPSLAKRLAELDADSQVEQRLAALREKAAPTKGPEPAAG